MRRLVPDNIELTEEAARTFMLQKSRGPSLPEDHLNLAGHVLKPEEGDGVNSNVPRDGYNTKTSSMGDIMSRRHDIGTIRISSFVVNTASRNGVVGAVNKTDEGPARRIPFGQYVDNQDKLEVIEVDDLDAVNRAQPTFE